MHNIQSIIIFNGGSAGDFLKSACIEQLSAEIYKLNPNGLIELNSYYFKDTTAKWYLDKKHTELDFQRVHNIENTHYYFDSYLNLTNNLFYIDYPENLQPLITALYINKRFNNDHNEVFQKHLAHIPNRLHYKITSKNIEEVINVIWLKNLKIWRSTPTLHSIDFVDLVKYETLVQVVEKIVQVPLPKPELLRKTHSSWIVHNYKLLNQFLNLDNTVD